MVTPMVTPILKLKQNQANKNTQGNRIPLFKRLYTLKEAAKYLGRSEWGMRGLIWSGKIPAIRVEGGRKIFLDIQDLDAFVDKNKSTYL
jgi:excisionase family DNA binding protein